MYSIYLNLVLKICQAQICKQHTDYYICLSLIWNKHSICKKKTHLWEMWNVIANWFRMACILVIHLPQWLWREIQYCLSGIQTRYLVMGILNKFVTKECIVPEKHYFYNTWSQGPMRYIYLMIINDGSRYHIHRWLNQEGRFKFAIATNGSTIEYYFLVYRIWESWNR